MRIGDWAQKLNMGVKKCEERPDKPAGEIVYRVKDLFTTRDGSWEPSDKPGSLPKWARDSYLRPWGADDYFDDAGGDHHIFARVLDLDGRPVKTTDLVICWSDGFHLLGRPDFAQFIKMTMTPKERSGWGNQPIWNLYYPDQGQVGAWCWCPRGAADVVVGGGMPYNLHVSTFAVWQAERPASGGTTPDELYREAVRRLGVTFDATSSFADYARSHNLGAPVTEEFTVGDQRAQGFAGGIVYAPIAQPAAVSHRAW